MLFLTGVSSEAEGLYSYADTPRRRAARLVVTTLDRLRLLRYPRRRQLFSPGLSGLRLRNHPLVRDADIIHLNWINYGFVDVRELIAFGKPIVWTMHDMWPFTGGCHHSLGCMRFRALCGACPVLGSKSERDLSSRAQARKARSYGSSISWVAVSSWMAEQAEGSSLLAGRKVSVIHSGIDTTVFRPQERSSARRELGLPASKKLVLLGAHDLRSPFKGLQFSIDAICASREDYSVVTFGKGSIDPAAIPHEVIHLGFIADPERLAKLYSSVDLFLATSTAEAFGKTVAEAQCCGTPVVAFDGTGPRDIVAHKHTGYLSRAGESADVAAGIDFCLGGRFDGAMISERAERFSIERCTDQYIELYERLMGVPPS